MKALIDGDVLVYQSAFTAQYAANLHTRTKVAYRYKKDIPPKLRTQPIVILENEQKAKDAMDSAIGGILRATKATSFQIFCTQGKCFRDEIYPEYKGNRTAEKPVYYDMLREYLKESYKACFVSGIEADDILGIVHMDDQANDVSSVICSIDKDMLTVPGRNYNPRKNEFKDITPAEAKYNFLLQMLIGDTADNIKGIPGVGPKTAEKILAINPDKQGPMVKNTYIETYGEEEGLRLLKLNNRLLFILRKAEGYTFRTSRPPFDSLPASAFTAGNLTPTQDNAASAFK